LIEFPLDVFEARDCSIEPFVDLIEPSVHAFSQSVNARGQLTVSLGRLIEQCFCSGFQFASASRLPSNLSQSSTMA